MNKMPAGKYWVGDLCYVMHDEWDEFCDVTIDGNRCLNGVFTLKDGRKFASFGTAYGDGYYKDNVGRGYGVDAGLIGCILLKDIDQVNSDNDISLGHVVDFPLDFEVTEHGGLIMIGDVSIYTGDEDCDYD